MDSYFRKSRVTGKEYDYFQCIKILNFSQAEFYIDHGVDLKDVVFSHDRKNGKKMVVFYFYKEETKDIFAEWCKLQESNS